MKGKKQRKNGQAVTKQKRAERYFRRKPVATSMYFLLWAIFTAISLFIVLISALTQGIVFTQSYKEKAASQVSDQGKQIERSILSVPEWAGGNYSGYLRMLSSSYDARIYIVSLDGKILFPQEANFDPEAPEVEEQMNFSEEMKLLTEAFDKTEDLHVVYEGEGEYVYASKVKLFGGGVECYLYVGKSLTLIDQVTERVHTRVVLVSVFLFILSFALTSAVSGWLTTPLTEMTKKARQLAQGDFDVDFRGNNYSEEMVGLAEALNFARDELSKTDRMQKELIANVSHDFKTPLTMIKAYGSMIIEISGDSPEKRNKHAQVIVDEADRLTSLVNDVLDLSKMNSGIESMKKQTVDMSAYVSEVMDRFAYYREKQGYTFVLDVEEGLYTCADEVRVGQVLYNLIGNAVNYTGEDKKVYVRLKKERENTFRFSVTDTGKGIKPEEIAGIWERYYRSAETHKRPVRGTGLGLSIVKTILERHGFVYGVESEVGKGSTFYVIFPLVEEE